MHAIILSIRKPISGDLLPLIDFLIIEEHIINTVFEKIYWFTNVSNPS